MEKTIVGMCRMKGYAQKYGGAHPVPVTEDMITGITETKSINDQRLKKEEEKKKLDAAEKQKDEEKKKYVEANLAAFYESKNSLEDRDKETVVKEKNAREEVEVALGILKHGTESLLAAKRDLTALGVTTVMIQSSQEKMAAVEEQLKNFDEERKRIRKRKTELVFSSEVELKKKKD